MVSVVWFAVGYSLAFTPGSAWIGGLDRLWFGGLDYQLLTQQVAINPIAPRIPEAAYAIFQMTFAIITAALIVGALVERMRFGALMLFMLLWSLFVYVPVAHWVWEPNGWLARMGALDFAGGAVVHENAGAAGLACACYLGRRTGYGREPFQPYNLGWTMLGSSLLWIGWFGLTVDLLWRPTVVRPWPWWLHTWQQPAAALAGRWESGCSTAAFPCWGCAQAWWQGWWRSRLQRAM